MLLSGLNPVQHGAASAVKGPILVVAGAGSGKTRVLTHRIANLVEEHDIFPSNIMAITFTNKAANEMKERIEALVGPVTSQMWVGTFHAICVRILRRDGESIGYAQDFVIYDTSDQKSLIKACYKALDIDEKRFPMKTAQYKISGAKNDMQTPESYEKINEHDYREREFIKLYKLYQDKLKANQAMDFDDLLLKTIELFKKDKEALARYQNRFRYIHVDEYQDTNRAQYELIRLLSGLHGNLFVVGDGDQSIYRWRGADIRNIQEFEKDFPGAQLFKLEQNYRSTKNILGLANSVIKHNPNRREKNLWTDADDGEKVHYHCAQDEKDEARFVVREMLNRMREEHYKRSDFAVLYRTNAQSRAFEDALLLEGIPYKVVGGAKFYERKEIKDLMAYLKLVVNRFDDVSFLRVINEPKRSIGDKTIEKLQHFANERGISLLEACGFEEAYEGISSKASTGLKGFFSIIKSLHAIVDQSFVSVIFDKLIEMTGIIAGYEAERTIEADGRIDNIYEFRAVIEEFEKRSESPTLRDFLAETSLRSDQDSIEDSEDSVLLMTLHASKGLEFPIVFLVGLEEQLFPSFRSMDDPEGLEEERRLCYVGITRAEKVLYITHAKNRNQFGRFEEKMPSCFLKEMDQSYLEGYEPKKGLTFGKPEAKPKPASFFGVKTKRDTFASKTEPSSSGAFFSAGDKVMHKMFGSGMVLSVDHAKDLITVVFDTSGIKKLSASSAPLVRNG